MRIKLTLAHMAAGSAAVIVGYSSSVVLVIETARSAGASPEQIVSWLVMLGLCMGASCIALSLLFKMPIVTAWSTPGAAFLISNVEQYSFGETIGACVLAGALAALTMQVKHCVRLIEAIPKSLSTAMLAGILLPFCLAIFSEGQSQLVYLLIFMGAYMFMSLFLPRYTMLALLGLALFIGLMLGVFNDLKWQKPVLVWMQPEWSLQSIVSLALPLYLVTMLSQNLPGIAIIQSHGYKPSSRTVVTLPSILQTLGAPLGAFTCNLAAISAALCLSKEAGDESGERYWAGVCAGLGYLLLGLFGAAVVSIFEQFPDFITVFLAGFALLSTVQANLIAMMNEHQHRLGALLTFLCCASGVSLFGLGAAVWALLLGSLFVFLADWKAKRNLG